MNPIARMMKRNIKTPLKNALPLIFIVLLVLVGRIHNDNKQRDVRTIPRTRRRGGGRRVAVKNKKERCRSLSLHRHSYLLYCSIDCWREQGKTFNAITGIR